MNNLVYLSFFINKHNIIYILSENMISNNINETFWSFSFIRSRRKLEQYKITKGLNIALLITLCVYISLQL